MTEQLPEQPAPVKVQLSISWAWVAAFVFAVIAIFGTIEAVHNAQTHANQNVECVTNAADPNLCP